MFTIETERLILSDWKRSDWKDAQLYAGDPEVSKYMIWGPNTEAQTREFIHTAVDAAYDKPRLVYELKMILKETGKIVGGCGMRLTGEGSASAMIGYVLTKALWGRGLTTEAAGALLKFGFHTLSLHRMYATCDTENTGSQRVLEKCGMRREAHFKEDMLIKGRWRDSYLYAILDSEWKNGR